MKSRWDEDENASTIVPCCDPRKMPYYNRWKLYFQWAADLRNKLLENIPTLQVQKTIFTMPAQRLQLCARCINCCFLYAN